MTAACRCLLLCAALASTAARAEEDPTADWPVASAAQLDQARGGFTTGAGVLVAFGVERLVSINGEIVASSKVNISDVIRPGPALAPDALVLQSGLNEQVLRSQTTINATLNSLSLLRSFNLEASLRSALGSVVGPK